jgi:hypothetical protein
MFFLLEGLGIDSIAFLALGLGLVPLGEILLVNHGILLDEQALEGVGIDRVPCLHGCHRHENLAIGFLKQIFKNFTGSSKIAVN